MFSLSFTFAFRVPLVNERFPAPSVEETEIYLPARRYGKLFATSAVRLSLSEGSWTWDDATQTLMWKHEHLKPDSVHTLKLTVPDAKHWKAKPANIDLTDSPLRWVLSALLAVLTTILAILMR